MSGGFIILRARYDNQIYSAMAKILGYTVKGFLSVTTSLVCILKSAVDIFHFLSHKNEYVVLFYIF